MYGSVTRYGPRNQLPARKWVIHLVTVRGDFIWSFFFFFFWINVTKIVSTGDSDEK